MSRWRILPTIILLAGLAVLIGGTEPLKAAQAVVERPSDDFDTIILDLMTGFSNALAARDRRYAAESLKYSRMVASLRAEQRRAAAGNRAAQAKIAQLKRELESLSWVREPRFRTAMIAYRQVILGALRTAGPRTVEGLRLIAAGNAAAGLEILRESARVAGKEHREAGALMHSEIERILREGDADRLRLIAVEAFKSVELRTLPAETAIADWLNVVAVGESNRGDHLILSHLYYLDGNEAEADRQRSIAATRPNPPERIGTILDELFGAPAAAVLDMLAIGPDAPNRLMALQAPLKQALAQRPDMSGRLRRDFADLFGGLHACTASLDPSEEPEAPLLADGGDRCLAVLSRAAALSARLSAGSADSPMATGPDWLGDAATMPSLADAAALYVDVVAAMLISLWSDPDLTPRALREAAPAPSPAVPQSPQWQKLAAGLRTMAAACPDSGAARRAIRAQACARIWLYSLLIPAADRPAPQALDSAITRLVRAIDSSPATGAGSALQAQLDGITQLAAETASRIDLDAGFRIGSALLESSLKHHKIKFPTAVDDFILLRSLEWYERFVRGRDGGASRRLHPTTENAQIFLRTLARRPTFTPSCYALLEFADALLASEKPLSADEAGMLESFLEPARSCGVSRLSKPSVASPDRDYRSMPSAFRDLLRIHYASASMERARRGDRGSARILADLVAFGVATRPPGAAVFLVGDLRSFASYGMLAVTLAGEGEMAEAIAVQTVLFESGRELATADPNYRPCEACPEGQWRPNFGLIARRLGHMYEISGDEQRAAEVYRSVIALNGRAESGLLWAHSKLGRFAAKRGDYEGALPHLRATVDLLRRRPPSVSLPAYAASPRDAPAPGDGETESSEMPAEMDELRELQAWAGGAGLGLTELKLRELILALHMTRRHAEAVPLHAELFANMLAILDRREANSDFPPILLHDGGRRCWAMEAAEGRSAGIRCGVQMVLELTRRSSLPGMAEAIQTASSSLKPRLGTRRARRTACAAAAGLNDSAERTRLVTVLGLACR